MTENHDSGQLHGTSKGKKEKKKKIRKALKGKIGIPPSKISKITGINTSTVRNYLRELEKEDKVIEKNGFYSLPEGTYGGPEELPKMENIRFKVELPEEVDVEHEEERIDLREGELNVVVGTDNHRVTAWISGDAPRWEVKEVELLGRLFKDRVKSTTDWEPSFKDVWLTMLEYNYDSVEWSLSGSKCITLSDFKNRFQEKLYDKEDRVRREVRINRPVSLETISGMLEQGIAYGSIVERLDDIDDDLEEVLQDYEKVVKGYRNIQNLLKELLDVNEEVRDSLRGLDGDKDS